MTANCISNPCLLNVLGGCIIPALLISKSKYSNSLDIFNPISLTLFKSDRSSSMGVNLPLGFSDFNLSIAELAFSKLLQATKTCAFFSARALAV